MKRRLDRTQTRNEWFFFPESGPRFFLTPSPRGESHSSLLQEITVSESLFTVSLLPNALLWVIQLQALVTPRGVCDDSRRNENLGRTWKTYRIQFRRCGQGRGRGRGWSLSKSTKSGIKNCTLTSLRKEKIYIVMWRLHPRRSEKHGSRWRHINNPLICTDVKLTSKYFLFVLSQFNR